MLFFSMVENIFELVMMSMTKNGLLEFSFNMLQTNTYNVVLNRKML